MRNIAKSLFVVPVLVFSMGACNNSGQEAKENKQNDAVADEWTASELAGKYVFDENGDTILLDLKSQNDSLIGPLSYNFQEKDKNHGEFRGIIKDSLLVGEYSFMSEGINSVRETVFGIVPEGLIEGFGDVEEIDSKFVFKNIDSLRFDHGMLLHKK